MGTFPYETSDYLNQYLLLHYGNALQQLPYGFGPKNSLHFPSRCVRECLNLQILPGYPRALDLGCAVGGSSFELARYCKRVLALDYSQTFINAAVQLQHEGIVPYEILGEGGNLLNA